jgi:hypothetical protein
MWASKLLTLQVTIMSVLLTAITIALAVEHPEWSAFDPKLTRAETCARCL